MLYRLIAATGVVGVLLLGTGAPARADHNNVGIVSSPAVAETASGPSFEGVSVDGGVLVFDSAGSLTPDDQDGGKVDVYERRNGVLSLVSRSDVVGLGNGAVDAYFQGMSDDGSHIFFETDEPLVAADQDSGKTDVYDRSAGATTLVSTGSFAGANTAQQNAFFDDASADGAHVLFHTTLRLADADNEGMTPYSDIYERFGGETFLVSIGPAAGAGTGAFAVSGGEISDDGSKAFFRTQEPLQAGDADGNHFDLYVRSARAATELLSTGSAPGALTDPHDAGFFLTSPDGQKAWFYSGAVLEPEDGDTTYIDVYERAAGVTTLISTSTAPGANTFFSDAFLSGVSADGTGIVFTSKGPFDANDNDGGQFDVFLRKGNTTTWVSTGSFPTAGTAPEGANFEGISSDASKVFFSTNERLEDNDNDGGHADAYLRENGQTTLVSTSTAAGAGTGAFDAFLYSVTPDGSSALFETAEKLDSADQDGNKEDVYEWSSDGSLALVSRTDDPQSLATPDDAFWEGNTADQAYVVFSTTAAFDAADTDATRDLYVTVSSAAAFQSPAASSREAQSVRQLRVRLTHAAPEPITVGYTLRKGTAGPGDFKLGGTGTIEFAPFATIATIPLRLFDDFLVEGPETVVVELTSATHAHLDASPKLTFTIRDNEPRAKCQGKDATMVGSKGPDTIVGTDHADVIVGRGGADRIRGDGGADTICGSAGGDRIAGGAGADLISGGGGNDVLRGEDGADSLDGGRGRDRLAGGDGAGDTCNGGPGTDTLLANHGCEVIDSVP